MRSASAGSPMPSAGLFPSWPSGYRLARQLDQALTALPGLRALSGNFELIVARAASPRDPATIFQVR